MVDRHKLEHRIRRKIITKVLVELLHSYAVVRTVVLQQ